MADPTRSTRDDKPRRQDESASVITESIRRRPLTRVLSILGASLLVASCGGDSNGVTAPTIEQTVGTYTLTQVRTLGDLDGGGSGLPVTFIDGSGRTLTFHSGTLDMGSDETFALSIPATFVNTDVEFHDEGSFSLTSSAIEFSSTRENPRLFSAVLSGNRMTAEAQFGDIPFEIDLVK